ncbi:TPA: hypothetical protein ACH3X1_009501 [Trebouxia sp. C0004]
MTMPMWREPVYPTIVSQRTCTQVPIVNCRGAAINCHCLMNIPKCWMYHLPARTPPKQILVCGTDETSTDSSSEASQHSGANKSQHSGANKSSSPCPATAAPSALQHQQADTHGNGIDTEVGDQASEAQFAAGVRTLRLARTPAFYKLLGLQEAPLE